MSKIENSETDFSDEYCFENQEVMLKILGASSENLNVLQQELKITMGHRGLSVYLKGERKRVTASRRLIDQFVRACRNGRTYSTVDLVRGARILADDPDADLDAIFNEVVYVTSRRRLVTPKGLVQKQYIDAIRRNDLTFSIGPAGTGKTYLAVAMAVSELMQRNYRRIVLTRPAVEAGEHLGFLPGDLKEKVNPYLRPLYDALDDMVGQEKVGALLAQEQIEIAPLAYMRGRTLNDSFVILDEAQNTTREQMKMFLTRLGFSSKAVVTGDISQVDLPENAVSGLIDARHTLGGINGISFIHFTEVDVVRHPLVQEIIKAYDGRRKNSKTKDENKGDSNGR